MDILNNDQKQLVFDFCVGVASEEEAKQVQHLISSNTEAAQLQTHFRKTLGVLDNLAEETCPDELIEKTILRINEAAAKQPEHIELERLLASEQVRPSVRKSVFWGYFGGRLAFAATFVIIGSLVLSSLDYARARAWQMQCQAQLGRIGQGLNNYSSDHNGNIPSVAKAAGTPWWKVGYSGEENYSNTRHTWLLVKGEYAKAEDFICPGKRQTKLNPIALSRIKALNDFPDRRYIAYSLRIICDQPKKIQSLHRKALMADMNPLFETIPDDFNKPLNLFVNEKLQKRNSINHKRRGQNVLFCDGSSSFKRKRNVEISNDDIYTLRDTQVYTGIELPSCESDAFLAP